MDLPAGRALDAEIAEKVMGYDISFSPLPHYSTDIAAAWLVVEQMREMGYWPKVSYLVDWDTVAKWHVDFLVSPNTAYQTADTAPLAICRAALACVASQHPTTHARADR
jgi:hypothetical protein